MNFKKSLSWKFLLPIGILVYFIFYGGALQVIGTLMVIFGIIDLIRFLVKKYKKEK